MVTISICMIVKDEELVLENALSSIKNIADEIVIIDTGSSDNTKQIASKFTDKIYDFTWCDDFAKARNYSFSKATCEYCMWLDADDVLLTKDQEQLTTLKHELGSDTSVVMMHYNTNFDEDGKPTFTYYRERLLRRKDNFHWQGFIHECITASGKVLYSDIAITHRKLKVNDPARNLTIFEKKISEGVVLNPREIFYYARELYYHNKFKQAINEFQKFLNTNEGWKENCISACQFMAYCYDQLDNKKEALHHLFYSFDFDNPRAEICCDIGKHFLEADNYQQAIYWYNVALKVPRDDANNAFIYPDCYNFIPYIQLCVCYYKLGDSIKANTYNELAGKYKNNHPSYQYNKEFFKNIT